MPQFIGSSTPLGGNGVYTSNWINSDFWSNVSGSIFADQSGTLVIEQSGDGISVDTSTTVAYTGNATTANTYNVVLVLPFVRLKYTNGATPQTTLRLYSRFVAGETPV